MKINFSFLDTGLCGGTRHLFEVASRLSNRGYDISITSLGRPRHYWFKFPKAVKLLYPETKYSIPVIGANIPLTQVFNKFSNNLGFPELDRAKLLAKSIPDVDINVASQYSTSYPVYWSGKGRMIYYVQHYEPETIFPKNSIERKIAEGSYYLPLEHFAVSHWLCDVLKEKTNKKAHYVGAGVDINVFKKVAENEPQTIMGIVRGLKWKGDEDLISAFDIAQRELRDAKFRVIGSKKVVEKMLANKNIHLKNLEIIESHSDEELVRLYSSSTIFVFASHLEGFGLPPLEAMACSTPVVTTDCKGLMDFCKNGWNSLIVKPEQPEEMADAIVKLINNRKLCDKFVKNALPTVKQGFTWEHVVDRFEKTL